MKTKLLAGYNRDHCIRIDQQFDQEKNKFNDIEDRYREYSSAFEEYLSHDHEESMKVLEEADQETRNSSKMISKRDRLLKEFGQVRLDVYQWREMWRDAKMCHEFVRKIFSPPEFNASVYKDDKSMHSEGESIVDEDPAAKSSLECLVETFEKEISDSNLGPGEISVECPLELSRIFSEIESRNLDALIHLESLAKPMEELTTGVAKTEEDIKKEIGIIEENIQDLESLIKACEQRGANLRAYADYLLQQVFRELVSSESVLYLQVFIEDAYESCVGPNHGKLDAFTMMRTIEKTYESLNMTLDKLPKEIVRQCEKEGFTQEMKMMREAEDAAQKFNLMHRLLAALERIMEPPELNIKSKSRDKDGDKSSKRKSLVSSRSSITSRQKNLQLKQLTMAKRSPEFLGDDKSLDQEIKDLTFEIKKLAKDYLPAENLSAEERHDCRDEIE
ncbi:GSCOCG00005153001-RA-CDS [Cotesia congregata]|nr:GSCOCG00005153001-RA-CDS [Cotesia congregata]